MEIKFIISFFAIAILISVFKKKWDTFKIITVLMSFSILLIWIPSNLVKLISYLGFALASLSFFIYTLRIRDKNKFLIFTIRLTPLFFTINLTFKLMHWPFASEIIILSTIPISLYLISLFFGIFKRKEFWIITLLIVDLTWSFFYQLVP